MTKKDYSNFPGMPKTRYINGKIFYLESMHTKKVQATHHVDVLKK